MFYNWLPNKIETDLQGGGFIFRVVFGTKILKQRIIYLVLPLSEIASIFAD